MLTAGGQVVLHRCPGRVVRWMPALEPYLVLVRRIPLDYAALGPCDGEGALRYLHALAEAWACCPGADDMPYGGVLLSIDGSADEDHENDEEST